MMPAELQAKYRALLIAALGVLTLLTIGIVWWLLTSGDGQTPVIVNGKPGATHPTVRSARRTAAPVGGVEYYNDLNGGNWGVTAGNAFMQVNTSGSYLFLTISGGLSAHQQSMLN